MPAEINHFALHYEMAKNKKEFVKSIVDLHNLPPEKKSLYAQVTMAINITDDVYNNCMLYMLNNHSNQNGINHAFNSDRLYAVQVQIQGGSPGGPGPPLTLGFEAPKLSIFGPYLIFP